MNYNKLFKNWKKDYLIEARIDKVKKRYQGNDETIEKLSQGDPSNNDKYLAWMAKQVIKNGKDADDVIEVTRGFAENRQRLDKKDIYQWKFDDLKQKVDSLGKSKTQQKLAVKDATVKIYEDEDYLFIAPLNTGASCIYGSGTRWCISADKDNMFADYAYKHEINFVFVFFKKEPPESPQAKIALCYYPEEKMAGLAQQIFSTVSKREQSFYNQDQPWKPTPYDDMSEHEIYDEVVKNPQEIFNATDDVLCNLNIPRSLTYGNPNIPQMMHRQTSYPSCGKKLDELLSGQWSNKYREIVYKSLGTIRGDINKEREKAQQGVMELFMEIEKWSESPSKFPLKYFKLKDTAYKDSVDAAESEILRNAGYKDGFTFATANIILPIQFSKLGIKPVEYSIEEKISLGAYFFKVQDVDKYVATIVKSLNNPKEKEAMINIIEYTMDDKFGPFVGRRAGQAVLNTFRESGYLPRMHNYGQSIVRNPDKTVDYSRFNIYTRLNSTYPDQYVEDYQIAKEMEENFGPLVRELKNQLLEISKYAPLKKLMPDREYFFWEPV